MLYNATSDQKKSLQNICSKVYFKTINFKYFLQQCKDPKVFIFHDNIALLFVCCSLEVLQTDPKGDKEDGLTMHLKWIKMCR